MRPLPPGYLGPIEVPSLPLARGSCTAALVDALSRAPGSIGGFVAPDDGPLDGDDFHLALHICHELHYRGFDGVDPDWEWHPALAWWTRELEQRFESVLRDAVGDSGDPIAVLRSMCDGGGPSLSAELLASGERWQVQEFAVHRSAYQLKEADPHTWVIPRLVGRAKAAAVRIQVDEYGDGVAGDAHAELFRTTMTALDLDPTYGAYVDVLPGSTLATGNLITLFGLHRRLRGALIGHLALFEMTSVRPMGRYAELLRRLGVGPSARRFYEVHVEADAVHERIAIEELVPALLEEAPELGPDVVFGARALADVEGRFADALRAAWSTGRSSLRAPLAVAA